MRVLLVACLLYSKAAGAGVQEGLWFMSAHNFEMAERELRPAAEAGDVRAQNYLGMTYFHPLNPRCNLAESIRWHEMAAERNDLDALFSLGMLYDWYVPGHGPAKAFQYNSRAAALDQTWAISRLGDMYLEGRGVARDEAKGVEFIRRAAERGDVPSIIRLGRIYLHGIGVPRDPAQAVLWFEKQPLSSISAVALAGLYATGEGVPKDPVHAFMLLKPAADYGSSRDAMREMARFYREGIGTGKDEGMALAWDRRADAREKADIADKKRGRVACPRP